MCASQTPINKRSGVLMRMGLGLRVVLFLDCPIAQKQLRCVTVFEIPSLISFPRVFDFVFFGGGDALVIWEAGLPACGRVAWRVRFPPQPGHATLPPPGLRWLEVPVGDVVLNGRNLEINEAMEAMVTTRKLAV